MPFRRTSILAACALVALSLGGSAPPRPAPSPASAWVAGCEDFDEWDKPGPPWRIHGNTWYVGTCGISAILVTGNRGHVLIDSGTDAGAAVVAANIERLGFRLKDVKLLLHTHEHFDHVGGMARLQRLTGARLIASPQAAQVLASGKNSDDDPQAGLLQPFPPARVDRVLGADGRVALGALRLTAITTPGHTSGALTWQWRSCATGGSDCRTIVYADSLNPISADNYRFSAHPAAVAAFRAGIARLAALDCDVLLTPHPGSSAMRTRLQTPGGLTDRAGCRNYAATITAKLDARLAKEATGTTP